VTGRFLFYNNSVYDGYSALADDTDDLAIATDKVALLPGEPASFANYTSYSRGINGVMFDLSGPDAASALSITADDVEFLVGNSPDPQSWGVAPEPSALSVREAGGESGPVRVSVIWADGAIRNRWLQVTVKANGTTGLASPDVFFFGNLPGETGNATTAARVTAADVTAVRLNLNRTGRPITDATDFNRDRRVNATDYALARAAMGRSLHLLSSGSTQGAAPAAGLFANVPIPARRTAYRPPSVQGLLA